jgi:hypothetical protein
MEMQVLGRKFCGNPECAVLGTVVGNAHLPLAGIVLGNQMLQTGMKIFFFIPGCHPDRNRGQVSQVI